MTLRTFTRSFGHGPRKALAFHCSLAHSGAWRGVGEALADELTMLAYDLPMHGKSGDWNGEGNVHDVATEMARDLLTERMDLIGHSFGATVALRLAIEEPELVRSVTMIEPVYYAAVRVDEPEQLERYYEGSAKFEAELAAGDRMSAARLFNRGWGDGTKWELIPTAIRDYMAARIHFVPASAPFLGDDSAGLLAPGRFERAEMPTLLIEGDQSPEMTFAINRSLERRLPNARRVVIDGAGHMAPITHPREVAAQIRQLLDQS